QSVTTPEDTATNIVLSVIDVDSTNLTFAILNIPTNGAISSFNTNTGALLYTPAKIERASGRARVIVSDGSLSATGTVSIIVTPVNDPPLVLGAGNQSVTTPEDTATNIVLSVIDVDSTNLVYAILAGPTNGGISSFNTNTGALLYTPA